MRIMAICAVALLAGFGAVAAAPVAEAAPPDLPPDHNGCNYFYWDNGDLQNGELPGYRYRNCIHGP